MNEMIKISDGKIIYDFTTLEAHITEEVEKYSGLQFTEDSKKEAKATIAELRKDQKDLMAKVKEVKAAWMKPFEEFEAKASAIIGLYNKPIVEIDGQIKDFEAKRKQEKQEHIKAIYDEIVPEEYIRNMMPILTVYDSRWENATTNDKQIRGDILTAKEATKAAIEAITAFHSDREADALANYKLTRDLASAIHIITSYEATKKEIEERRAMREHEQELARIREESRMSLIAEMKLQNAVQEAVESFIPTDDGSAVGMYTYRVMLNDDAKIKLESFMDSVGIDYECR